MNTVQTLLDAVKDIWSQYHVHPFVLGIRDGTLDREKFLYYIIQDYLYLMDYARTFAIGVAKARSKETANLFAKYIAVMNGELDVHSGYMGKLGVTQEEIETAKQSLDSLSYTSYMLRIRSTIPFTAIGSGAMPPRDTPGRMQCYWIYWRR